MPTIKECQDALSQPFFSVFIDGRNEFGAHVLPIPPDSIGDERHIREIVSYLEDQQEGLAEKIIREAESFGFEINHCVATIWRHSGGGEMGDYFEYLRVDSFLTELLHGSPDDQRKRFANFVDEQKPVPA